MTTTDGVIDDTIGELIAELQNGGWMLGPNVEGDNQAASEKLEGMVDRLIQVRTQLRNGRGDDWLGVADPIENLALAGYRADAIINKKMTPPNWDFANDAVKASWRSWATSVLQET